MAKLLREKSPRPEYQPHIFEGNLWLSAAQHLRKGSGGTTGMFHTSYHIASHGIMIERGC